MSQKHFNNIKLKESVILAGNNLLNCLCPRENYLPYWHMHVTKEYYGEFALGWPNHNIGRWWDEFTWKGDEILGVYPNSSFFPFYLTLDK